MRAYTCSVCDHVCYVLGDGGIASAVRHDPDAGTDREGTRIHEGAVLVELLGHDHVAGIAWHQAHPTATRADILAAFPPLPIRPTMALGESETIVPPV